MDTHAAEGSTWRRRIRPNTAAFVLAVALGCMAFATLIAALVRDDANVGDLALIELRIRDVLSADSPLVGAYSRYGWSHPGPFMFDVFAIPYRVFGNDATALRLATLLFNVAVLAVVLWLLRRRGTAAVAAVGAAVVMLIWGLPAGALSVGWNVTVTDLPFILIVVGCWCALRGDSGALLATAIAASFAFQSHVGVGIVLGPVFAATLVIVAVRAVRDGADWRRWCIGAGVVALTFVPTLVDLFANWPGNLGALVRWSVSNDEPSIGLADAGRMLGRVSSLSFPFDPQMPGRFLLDVRIVETGVAPGASVVLLIVAATVAWRRGWKSESTLCAVLGVVWASAVVATTSITRPLGWWLFDWFQPLGWLTWAAIALVAWRALQGWNRNDGDATEAIAVGTWLALLAFAVVGQVRGVVRADDRIAEVVRPVRELTAAAESVTEPGDKVRIDVGGAPLLGHSMMAGLANRLDASGREVCVDHSLAHRLGTHRACDGDPGWDVQLVLRSESVTGSPPVVDGMPTSTVLVVDPLTAAERAEADQITADLADILVRDGRGDEVGLLETELAGVLLADSPSPELLAEADRLDRLVALRQVPGGRYGLYVVDR